MLNKKNNTSQSIGRDNVVITDFLMLTDNNNIKLPFIVARVNDYEITLNYLNIELMNDLMLGIIPSEMSSSDLLESYYCALESIIEHELIVQKMNEDRSISEWEPDKEQITDCMQELFDEFGIDVSEEYSKQEIEELVVQELRMQRFIDNQLGDTRVSKEEIEYEYQNSPENGEMQMEYIRVILEYEKLEEKYKAFVLDLKKAASIETYYDFTYLK
ncbi:MULTISPECIES: hypothetical protein [unclassified Lysinibacillus]|uniref:hypothetical protein n=1 Tax=unclassified Lysinibacillus TaxID=2636778 RepID=UPI0020138037|nr:MULTISPECIES: hypothetical protein [unclassified Lysinibacillus]MCL1696785.1 hypothetical protein [Lysinibacillus sp. BPa_S21]MCL1700350.1 hypothetical protein [Lysinibacillus sp. Bpr_S20]